MPLTLVTGGAGLVGSHVVRLLCERGDDVRVAVRRTTRRDNLPAGDVRVVTADLLDRAAVRRALRGVDRVFHVAGLTSMRAPFDRLYRANVLTTRTVLEEARRADVQRVVMTSSVAAVGPARRGSTDVNRSSTELVRRFLRREIPAYVDGALNIVDAEDVARGHLLADERGRLGERYILGNRNFTLDRLFADLGRLSGVEPPALKLPLPAALALARAAEALPGRPPVTVGEVRASSLWWAYRSNRARRELGWRPSHHEDTLQATIDWYREREPERLAVPGARQPVALRVTGFGLRQAGGALGRLRV